jgi:hypothetical protein
MALAAEEAAEAIELMPTGILDHELDPDKVVPMELIKYNAGALVKINYPGYHIDGAKGTEEVIPRAIHCYQVIERITGLTNEHKVEAFIRSLYGGALTDAEAELARSQLGITNADNGVQAGQGQDVCTSGNFIARYCYLAGDEDSRHNQLEGIRYLKKPTSMPVQRWKTVLYQKNEAVAYLQGNTEQPYSEDQMKRYFFDSCPKAWRDEYTSNGANNLNTADITQIVAFMKRQEARSRAKSAANRVKQLTNNKDTGDKRAHHMRRYDGDRPDRSAPGGRNNRSRNDKHAPRRS